MYAMTLPEFGDSSVLSWQEVPDPIPAADEVVLAVAATAVNRADILQRQGFYPPPAGSPEWPGLECSGTVIAVGDDVTDWSVGDQACALLSGGGYAERVAVPAGQLLPIPAGISLLEAAALPEVACTVFSNVMMTAALQPGEVFLVHGGSSGIGTMAIQLAHQLGARVAVTAGTGEKLQRCANLGADILINYRESDFVEELKEATGGAGANVILDNMGASYLQRNISALAVNGRLVIIGMQGGVKADINLGALLAKRAAVIATTLRARPAAEKAAIVTNVVQHVWPLIADGTVQPIIHSEFPLTEAAAAHELVESSAHVGKVLLLNRA